MPIWYFFRFIWMFHNPLNKDNRSPAKQMELCRKPICVFRKQVNFQHRTVCTVYMIFRIHSGKHLAIEAFYEWLNVRFIETIINKRILNKWASWFNNPHTKYVPMYLKEGGRIDGHNRSQQKLGNASFVPLDLWFKYNTVFDWCDRRKINWKMQILWISGNKSTQFDGILYRTCTASGSRATVQNIPKKT